MTESSVKRTLCFFFIAFAQIFLSNSSTHAEDMLELKVPTYSLLNASMEDALRELNRWGLQVCLEKPPLEGSDSKLTLELNGASFREILDSLVKMDKRYTWEKYRRGGVHLTNVVNVFPMGAKKDKSNIMNLAIKRVTIHTQNSPENIIPKIDYFLPELAMKLYPQGRGAISLPQEGQSRFKSVMDFEFVDLTVREILNEIILRTSGLGWVYEHSDSAQPVHRWSLL